MSNPSPQSGPIPRARLVQRQQFEADRRRAEAAFTAARAYVEEPSKHRWVTFGDVVNEVAGIDGIDIYNAQLAADSLRSSAQFIYVSGKGFKSRTPADDFLDTGPIDVIPPDAIAPMDLPSAAAVVTDEDAADDHLS
jgi:hypothetical protein